MSQVQIMEAVQVIQATEQYNSFSSGLGAITDGEVHFSKGLSAFEDYKSFTYRKEMRLKPFIYMHSTHNNDVSFVCVDPFILTPEYKVELFPAVIENLGLRNAEDAIVLSLVSVGKDMYTTTANLMSPIVINPVTMKAEQVFMEDLGIEYLRYNVWDSIGKYTSLSVKTQSRLEAN